ncbi:MAG: cytochrome c3 family protein [Nitrospinae bacterium]|nr:cytochrome c3 family protein [Nitrospinota bacterium]
MIQLRASGLKDTSKIIPSLFIAISAVLSLPTSLWAQAAPASAQVQFLAGDKAAIPPNYLCVNCHLEMADERLTPPVNDWMDSVHRQAGVRCADCHGGDPFDEAMIKEPSAGYIGKPKTEDIPKLCSKCHSDHTKMREYNLRADQFTLYSDSVHGRKLQEGDTEAPTCVSCHGMHKILKVKDPNSPTARKNIPETCGQCHAKKEVFEKRGRRFDQLALYKTSRHYELYAKGDLLVPTCFDCHGNHGIQPVMNERTQTVCFNCHAQQAEYYKASKHYDAFKRSGSPVCLHCHSNHGILRPTPADFTGDRDLDCVGCHEEGSAAYLLGKDIQQVAVAATTAVESAMRGLEDIENNAHGGFEIGELKERMAKASDGLKELHSLTHKMDIEALKKQSEGLIQISQSVSAQVDQMWGEVRKRRIGLVMAWLVFIGFMTALWYKSKELEKGRED